MSDVSRVKEFNVFSIRHCSLDSTWVILPMKRTARDVTISGSMRRDCCKVHIKRRCMQRSQVGGLGIRVVEFAQLSLPFSLSPLQTVRGLCANNRIMYLEPKNPENFRVHKFPTATNVSSV